MLSYLNILSLCLTFPRKLLSITKQIENIVKRMRIDTKNQYTQNEYAILIGNRNLTQNKCIINKMKSLTFRGVITSVL